MSKTTQTAAPSPIRRNQGEVIRRLVPVFPAGQPIRIEGARLEIGREPERGGLAIQDERASRRHAEIVRVPEYDVLRIKDLDSKNGTFVNGQKIDAEYLTDGSVLRVGDSLFVAEELRVPTGVKAAVERFLATNQRWSLHLGYAHFLADKAAKTDASVVIRGPTGAGKELLARAIHKASGRSGDLVTLNCSTFTRELLASELFGSKRGAFTNARADRAGLFASAAGGTLFLDEVAEMPLDQQPALLRALQEKLIRPVGSDVEVAVDVRIIAASHQDLEKLSERGSFRSDLQARLTGLLIELPGLSVRRAEVLSLLSEFLGVSESQFTLEAAEALLCYAWPKNVRELQQVANTVRLFRESSGVIDASLLPAPIRAQAGAGSGPEADQRKTPNKDQLEALLRKHSGNVSKVAQELGKHRNQIHRWMEAFGLDPATFRGQGDDA